MAFLQIFIDGGFKILREKIALKKKLMMVYNKAKDMQSSANLAQISPLIMTEIAKYYA